MALGLLDLSIVTHRLIQQLKACTDASLLWEIDPASKPSIDYTGLAPDAARAKGESDCRVSLYLFHVAVDKFHRNTFPTGGPAQTVPQQPLSLTLYYLLTAYSPTSHIHEQQAMSVALKCFHDHPIVTAAVPVTGTVPLKTRDEEFTLTLEPQTSDESGRLWQAVGAAMRLSAVYRASVVFLEPPPPRTPKPVSDVVLFTPDVIEGEPEPILVQGTDAQGRAAVTIPGAGFLSAKTTVQVHGTVTVTAAGEVRVPATRLQENTTANPLGAGEFRVVSDTTLDVRLPAATPRKRYLLHVRPSPGQIARQIWLDVPP